MSIWTDFGAVVSRVVSGAAASVIEAVRTVFEGDPETRRRVAFSVAMVALSAKMAKADGIVTFDEMAAFQQVFAGTGSGRRDPVMQHCRRHSVPIIWDQKTYLDRDAIDIWETQAPFGYRNGIAMALHVLVSAPLRPEQPALRPRELEVLRWTMDGKTAWEVAAVLGITERTVVLHLQHAMQRLDCASKHQAVLKALRLGLIA